MTLDQEHINKLVDAAVPLAPSGRTVNGTPPPIFRVRRLADVEEVPYRWYWPKRLPWGETVVLAGDGAVGKSTVAAYIAADVTRGIAPPGGERPQSRGVLIVSPEETGERVIRARMRLAGADLSHVWEVDPDDHLSLPSGGEALGGYCDELDIDLVVIDPAGACMDEGFNSNREEHIRAFLAPLQKLAQRREAIVLVIAHLNKGGGDSGHRMMGGAAWRNAPRAVLLTGAPPGQDPRETGERMLLVEKSNQASYPPALTYRIESHPDDADRQHIVWGAEVAGVSPHDLVRSGDEDRTETEEAAEWLRAALYDGPRPARDLKREAGECGIGDKALRTARKRLHVIVKKEGFTAGARWVWDLPGDDETP